MANKRNYIRYPKPREPETVAEREACLTHPEGCCRDGSGYIPEFVCTRKKGHPNDKHVAATSEDMICATWDDTGAKDITREAEPTVAHKLFIVDLSDDGSPKN